MMGGIEFRWHKTFSTSQPRLEYRIKQDHGSYAGMFNPQMVHRPGRIGLKFLQ